MLGRSHQRFASYEAKGAIILTKVNAARSTSMDKSTERVTPEPSVRDVMLAAIPNLRAFAISLSGNADRADDLVQETVMRAMANIDSFTPGTNMAAWLFTICAIDFARNIASGAAKSRIRMAATWPV